MIKKIKNNIVKFAIIFSAFILSFILLLTLVYTIPNSLIRNNVTTSISILNTEKTTDMPFFYDYYVSPDPFTDKLMFEKTLIDSPSKSALQAAMDINNYARYWHGYQLILRPMMLVTSYIRIRYINMFVMLILLGLVFAEIKEKINTKSAVAFMMSMASVYIIIVPMSMQYNSAFVVMLCSMYLILRHYNPTSENNKLAEIFFIIGMMINFFDLLTAPIITLGMPLILVLLMNIKSLGSSAFKRNFSSVFKYSSLWTIGYSLTWASKWIIASVILKRNVIQDAVTSILIRTEGTEQYPLNRVQMMKRNVENLLLHADTRKIMITFAFILLIAAVMFVLFGKRFEETRNILPIILVSIFPYIWFNVLANHSQIHYWFTYRDQVITVFGVLISLLYIIQWDKIKLVNMRKRVLKQ